MEHTANAGPPIFVQTAVANVVRGATPVPIRGREREIVVALAVQPRPIASDALGQLLNPEWDEHDASNNVKVQVYRLRKRVAPDFIAWHDGGYVFGPSVRVDAADARRAHERLSRSGGTVAPDEREPTLALAQSLRADPPSALLSLEWYAPVARSLRRLGREIALLIGRNDLERGGHDAALGIARELTYEDPCDEEAWELLIRAHLSRGEQPAAVQGLRLYETALAAELQTSPSPYLHQLVGNVRAYRGSAAAAL